MRSALLLFPLLLCGCGGAFADGAEVEFLPVAGKVTSVTTVKCTLKPIGATQGPADDAAEPEAAAEGDCTEMTAKSRSFEHRGTMVNRALEVTYAYTGPDGGFYQGKGELEQPLELPVPRAGDKIDLLVHPEQADTSRLP